MAIEIVSRGKEAKPLKVKASKNQVKDIEQVSQKNVFDLSSESIGGKIARNLYKPVASTVSTLVGMPTDTINFLSDLTQTEQDTPEDANWFTKISDWLGNPSIPRLPEFATSRGLKENVTKPIGEALFGIGSQEKQPGMIEDLIDRASEWAPYTIGPAALGALKGAKVLPGLMKGLGLNLAQGAAGFGAETLGLGETGQFLAEAGTGALGSLLGSTLKKEVPQKIAQETSKSLKSNEKVAWDNIRKASREAPVVSSQPFKKSLESTKKTLISRINPDDRKGAVKLVDEIMSSISSDKISPEKLVEARNKINSYYRSSAIKGTSGILGELKGEIDKSLGESLGKIQQKGLDATITFKEFKKSDAYKKFVRNKDINEGAIKKLIKSPLSWVGGAIHWKSPELLIGALGVKAYKNIEPVLKNKETRTALLKAIGKPVGAQAAKTAAAGVKKRPDKAGAPSGIELVSRGS